MPSVYGYRHVELDKVGKGKRVLKPPGGECSDIFGSGGTSPTASDSSGATTPTGRRVSDAGLNTQNRLFGESPVSLDNSSTASPGRRASIDRMKSNIFSGGDYVDSTSPSKNGSAKKAARRNPITGEILDESEDVDKPTNGHTNGKSNGHSVVDEEKVIPTQNNNVRVRKPPGGESSGIF